MAAVTLAIAFVLTVTATPAAQAQTYMVIHNFSGNPQDGAGPFAGLTVNTGGTLYGTTWGGGLGYGTVFRLTEKGSNWVFNLSQ